ncbi:hypothetical protein HMI54_005882 [Coelomomyces lativittatus]|nr:hypothetical protein HMI56_000047 [Coelomomyces lativittatus]KAJ1517353.1 hypothetical protein HMI54_005882 [Coelomomyces lativittatus]KAJ1518092.1 hypothetical protein HMI55_003150 [Coelomomyces lativittatus]
MNAILEKQRRSHEAIERLENLAASLLLDIPKTHKERLTQSHRVVKLADKVKEISESLLRLYEDKNGLRSAELERYSGGNDFSEFYSKLKEIKDYHRRHPNELFEPMELEFMDANQNQEDEELLDLVFSGEEHYGKILDLHECHKQFINLKNISKLSYVAYLEQITEFHNIPFSSKSSHYHEYLSTLSAYLESFISRSQPLFDLNQLKKTCETQFETEWTQGTVLGWNLAELWDASETLYCEPCQKQFFKQTVFEHHLKEKKHLKAMHLPVVPKEVSRPSQQARWMEKSQGMAQLEFWVLRCLEHLRVEVLATLEHVERKQTLTETELQEEWDDARDDDDVDDDGSDDDEEKVYNPLKLPLGWDSKPIPYWLYKLHGLGVEYPCEICGNYVYMGRKAFERHFQEWRHAHGMKCLGIPNTRQFHEITLIEDALGLWEKIKATQVKKDFRPDVEEEFEDSEGNVFNRKTYEDLLRQGLL